MILDRALTMSDRQALVASSYSTDTVDLGQAYSNGNDALSLYIHVIAQGGTSPTLVVELETSSDNSTFTKVIGITKPTVKRELGCALKGLNLKRYNRVRHVLGGTSPTFTLTAGFVVGCQQWEALPDSPRQS